MGKIRIFPERCTGCRVCELVCSFHFTGAFSRKGGAIEVSRKEAEGKLWPTIFEEPTNLRPVCDSCSGEQVSLCVKYCVVRALEIIGG